MNIGQYPDPTHTILHLSDTHFVEAGRPLYGVVYSDANLAALLKRLSLARIELDAIVITGDLADRGAPDAYERLRALVEEFAGNCRAPIVWVMGNHDDRGTFREQLLADTDGKGPIDYVHDVGGLRIIALDSTVPGAHYGEISTEQSRWLERELSEPAEHGTILALHHPPVPTVLPLLQMVELREPSRLETVVCGTDVRAIIAGHFHYSTHSMFAGVPVSVAAATCYTQDLAVPLGDTRAQDAAQGASLVHVYADRVVHSDVSMLAGEGLYEITKEKMTSWLAATERGEAPGESLLQS